MSAPFVAEIRMFACNFAPTGWAMCNGQLLPISQNTALFSLLGTFYGGDGKSTFALPNLQGSIPLHQGQGPGLSNCFLGESGGSQAVTLLQSEIPAHNHIIVTSGDEGDDNDAPNNLIGANGLFGPATNPTQMAFQALAPNGGSQPHNNMMPYLVINFCVAMQGVFPPRS